MSRYQSEFDKFFNPDDISEWLERTVNQNMITIGAELITPSAILEGYIEVLLKQSIADEIALISSDGETKTLREVLEIMRRNVYNINRALSTFRAYTAAYVQQHPDS